MELVLPEEDKRVILLGDTGSGKTFLAERMAAYFPSVQYLDPKGEFVPQVPYHRTNDLRQAWRMQGHVLVRPKDSQDHRDWWEYYLAAMLKKRKRCVILVDEVYLLGGMNHTSYPKTLAKLAVVGRSKGLPLWCGIQRPKFAPTVLFAQAEHWYIFPLGDTDLDVLKGWIPEEAIEAVRQLRYDYGFVHVQKVRGGRKKVTVYGPLAA